MREEDLQLARQMVANSVSSSLEEENDGRATVATTPGNSPRPLRRVLDLSERRKQFRFASGGRTQNNGDAEGKDTDQSAHQ